MSCTTMLVGKETSFDGSTIIARNEDVPSAEILTPKKIIVVEPEEQPRHYRSVISHVQIDLPEQPLRYTCHPNGDPKDGIWGAAGVNSANVAMTATETITSNPRVYGADPLVVLQKAEKGKPEVPGGIGEEDIVTLTLPYIRSAREGVQRLGSLLETYGTYENNGIAFADADEIWWLETIGGHHWIARRLPDDSYAVIANQFSLDDFDLEDALGAQQDHMCSRDLREFIAASHLDLSRNGTFNARLAFGSHTDSDHVYNTPRVWFGQRYLNPNTWNWDGPEADFGPEADDLPWCWSAERKITIEDIYYILSSHYQGTDFDPYSATAARKGIYRCIGVNRNNFLSIAQLRPGLPRTIRAVEWNAMGSNVYNALFPLYSNVSSLPAYVSSWTPKISTETLYGQERILAALADPIHNETEELFSRMRDSLAAQTMKLLHAHDTSARPTRAGNEAVNRQIVDLVHKANDELLEKVLIRSSLHMKNGFLRQDD